LDRDPIAPDDSLSEVARHAGLDRRHPRNGGGDLRSGGPVDRRLIRSKFGLELQPARCNHGPVPAPAIARHPAAAPRLIRGAGRAAPASAVPTTARGILDLQRTAGNRAVASAIAAVQREGKDQNGSVATDKAAPRRTTGFLGLNPGADKEAAKLKKTTREDVLVSLNDPAAEAKLNEDPGVADFVFDELGFSVGDFARWDKATDVLLTANKHIREQLAEIMRWFNRAENGDIILDRLVLSGHSNGVELWGESQRGAESQPGSMLIDRDLRAIADVFPKAAAQVEDIMFSACFSINAVNLVIKVFPNLQTAWSYSAYSPSVKQGSAEHVAECTRATEGSGTLKRSNRRGTSALWTREKGFVVGDPSLAAAGPLYTEAIRKWDEIAQPMYDGTGADVSKDALNPVYEAIQRMMAHPGTPVERKQLAERIMQILLRLRFWPLVRERFGAEYRDKLQPTYDALEMTQPEWASITRKALKAHVEAVGKALEGRPDGTAHKEPFDRYVSNGIYALKDHKIVKSEWI